MGELSGEIAVGVVAAVVVGAITFIFTPVGNRLRRRVLRSQPSLGVRIHTELDPARTELDPLTAPVSFYFRKGEYPSSKAPDGDLKARWKWAHEHGGFDVGTTVLTLTLEAVADTAFTFGPPNALQSRTPVEPGELSTVWGLGGGFLAPMRYQLDLDKRAGDVTATFVPQVDRPEQTPSFYLSKGEVVRMEIVASALRGLHTWTLRIPIIVDGKSTQVSIPGGPFVTVGEEDAAAVCTTHIDNAD